MYRTEGLTLVTYYGYVLYRDGMVKFFEGKEEDNKEGTVVYWTASHSSTDGGKISGGTYLVNNLYLWR